MDLLLQAAGDEPKVGNWFILPGPVGIHRLRGNSDHNFLSKTAFPIAKNDVFDHKKSFWQSYIFVWDRNVILGDWKHLLP